ncbi:MAG: sigma-E factor negative regulatory protein [Steroidobacteraceae bacterium]
MNRDELDSQLSAMFDGELPAAECELLSRRLMREEQLRATWSRYAVIGAALRAEPVAEVRPDFARRVSAQLHGTPANAAVGARSARAWRGAALGAAVAASVAGAAIMLLRGTVPAQEEALVAYSPTVEYAVLPRASGPRAASQMAVLPASRGAASDPGRDQGREPASYVVPPRSAGNTLAIPAALANYAIAHSSVSSPLVRGSLLSTLIGNEAVLPFEVTGPAATDAHTDVPQ